MLRDTHTTNKPHLVILCLGRVVSPGFRVCDDPKGPRPLRPGIRCSWRDEGQTWGKMSVRMVVGGLFKDDWVLKVRELDVQLPWVRVDADLPAAIANR